jgi:dTDP-4-dehydrorhamnose reductase
MPRKIVITGGDGRLAGRLAAWFSRRRGAEASTLSRRELDITDRGKVETYVEAFKPDVVINTAAMLTETCEKDPAAACHVNAWGPRNLALACRRVGAVLVQISTSGLFGDEVKAYTEYDPAALKTVYAKSKFAGEQLVREHCPRHIVLRLGWLYGSGLDGKPDFVTARIHEAKGRETIESAGDKHGTPVFADDAAAVLDRLVDGEEYGVFHAACQGESGCSRAEYVSAVLRAAGSSTLVQAISSGGFPRLANVPDCEMMDSLNLEFAGVGKLPPWRESLERYVSELRERGL